MSAPSFLNGRRAGAGFLLLASALGYFGSATGGAAAWAGTFNIPHFVNPGEFAVGLEPELTLTNGAGLGFNAKYTHGLNEILNAGAVIGTGGGPRKLRAGANLVLDFFPDIEGQPGIGFATTGIYYRLADSSQFELSGVPYIHKTFVSGKSEIEPFLSVPLGIAFGSDGRYRALAAMNVGSMFKSTENFRYILEFGIAINNTESTISGGVVYYH